MNCPRTITALCASLLLAGAVQAQVLPNRAALGNRVNSTVTEDFESYSLSPGGAEVINVSSLDENTITSGAGGAQGPGLVLDGCTYSCSSYSLQWNDQNYYGMPSRNILSNAPDGILTLTYDSPVSAIGFDLHAYQGYPDSTIVTVYNGSGSVIYTSSPISVPGPTGVFFGYQAASIGKVTIAGQVYSWSTLIDDHQYGSNGPSLSKSGSCPGPVGLRVDGATPSGPVAILHGQAGSYTRTGNPCNGIMLGISNPTLGAIIHANGSGVALLSFNAPAGACGRTVQAVDVNTCATTNTIIL